MVTTTASHIGHFWMMGTPSRRQRLRRVGMVCSVFAVIVVGICPLTTRVDVLAYPCSYHPGAFGSGLANADLQIRVSDYVVDDFIGHKDCVWIPQSSSGLPVFYWR